VDRGGCPIPTQCIFNLRVGIKMCELCGKEMTADLTDLPLFGFGSDQSVAVIVRLVRSYNSTPIVACAKCTLSKTREAISQAEALVDMCDTYSRRVSDRSV
jgi:hypothetical protein